MATKRALKAEIITLRNRVDALAARVAALEGKASGVVGAWCDPVVTSTVPGVIFLGGNADRVVDGARRA